MKKLLALVSWFVFFDAHPFAQSSDIVRVKAGEDPAKKFSPYGFYRFPTFSQGVAAFKHGGTTTAKFNYHLLNEEMQFIAANGDTLALADPFSIKYITVDSSLYYYSDGYIEIIEKSESLKLATEVQETMKWSFPHFDYNGILCSMAAFKQHCSFGFWKASIMKDTENILKLVGRTSMGHFDKITSLKDLPPDKVMLAYIKEAVSLNEDGVKLPARKKRTVPADIVIPESLAIAFRRNKKAQDTFDQFSPSHKREYIEWITEAKTDATREKRVETTIEWLAEGKSRNWKYER